MTDKSEKKKPTDQEALEAIIRLLEKFPPHDQCRILETVRVWFRIDEEMEYKNSK